MATPTRGVTSDAGAGDTTCGDVGTGWLLKAEKRRLLAPVKRLRGVERLGSTGGRGSAAAACCSPRRRSSSWYPLAMVAGVLGCLVQMGWIEVREIRSKWFGRAERCCRPRHTIDRAIEERRRCVCVADYCVTPGKPTHQCLLLLFVGVWSNNTSDSNWVGLIRVCRL